MRKIFLLALFFLFALCFLLIAVKGQKISDNENMNIDGLTIGFNILNKESVAIEGKLFERYKVSGTLTNNSGKSFNIRLSNVPGGFTNTTLVELDCLNATGARLTSKKLTLKLKAQNLNVTYWSYDKAGNFVSSVIPIVAGYYLDPGDVASDNVIFIVPHNEEPEVMVRKLQ